MNCFLATAGVVFSLMWIVPSPQIITQMTDYDECVYMASEGCLMVDKCSPGTFDEQTYAECITPAVKNCDKYKEKK